jgi:hypothetical protein
MHETGLADVVLSPQGRTLVTPQRYNHAFAFFR